MPASDWSDLCQQTVVWERMTGRDQYGKPIYAAPQTFSPNDDQGGRRVFTTLRRPAGGPLPGGAAVDYVQGSYIWLLATPNIGLEDRVYIAGDSAYPPVLSVERYPDETGQDLYTKITLGSANG